MNALKQGVDVVVGTPGRVIDLIKRGSLNLLEVQFVVLGDVDRILNMGFGDDVETILGYMMQKHQTIMLSATMLTQKVKNSVSVNLVRDPIQKLAEGISLFAISTKVRRHLSCEALQCGISQFLRKRNLSAVQDGRFNILVAADDDQIGKPLVEDNNHYGEKSSIVFMDAENSASLVSISICLDSIWFWRTQLELYGIAGLTKKIVIEEAHTFLHYLLNPRMAVNAPLDE
ncbi:DEAD-box ATP-dependent RNA helicase 53-like [Olea europaea subsp. europaea]|uniref:DEAD-box ATP-dependent RNA helicase 53-like n=1 Tax=Olea europaea subsp. europaea TaxID=158383 RepID=A0A8S0QMQ6_OLEEU|nr:DEAD-box ATP-dependent RNA helicase 53-like [Olea europaea subsp. europaea]